jgi:hypothetical protein
VRKHELPALPLFFKVWFAFIACLVGAGFVGLGFLVHGAVSAGPEGLGRAVGSVLKGIEQGRQ